MTASLRATCFALALGLFAERGYAAVQAALPSNVVIANLSEHEDLLFVLYEDGHLEHGYVIDPKSIPPGHEYRLRASREGPDNPGPPIGSLSLIGVPRKLMDERKNVPDPKWLAADAPGIVHISGVLHNTPVEKHSALHPYRLEKTEKGLQLILTNPDVLTRYPAENLHMMAPKQENSDGILRLVLIGALAAVLIGVLVWRMKSRGKA